MNMQTEVISSSHPAALEQAAAAVQNGGVIAFPTDTVYGIGVSAFAPQAIERIYQVKGRSHLKAIPILVGAPGDLEQITPPISGSALLLIRRFWPGALTLVLPLLPSLPSNLSPTPTVGVRMPDHELTLSLLQATGPLAATSANLSGDPPALNAAQTLQQLAGRVDLILDGGQAPGGTASTVVDCTGQEPILLREGPLAWNEITRALQAGI